MLVHVTRFTAVQQKVAELVSDEVKALQQRLKRGDGNAPDKIVVQLRELWEKDFEPTTSAIGHPDLAVMPWSRVEPHLYAAVTRIKVRTVNGSAGDILDYVDNQAEGLNVIAVGGDKLSRGLTLEGLSVSYYLRASKMYDTLMQMGRWFGYRPGYLDLCRLYTTDELIRWYRHITSAGEELRNLFDYMASIGSTPRDFGFRVKSHPDGLMITGAAKMRHGTELQLSFAGSISETVVFEKGEAAEANYKVAEQFIKSLGPPDEVIRRTKKLRWNDVPASAIVDGFLAGITTPEQEVVKVRPELLRKYIQKQGSVGELGTWTVVLVGTTDGTEHTLAGHKIGLIERSPLDPENTPAHLYRIRRVLSPSDEWLDLTDEEVKTARARTQAAWTADPGRSDRKTSPDVPSGTFIREVRDANKGLLLIYPLDTKKTGTDKPLIGFAFSFPDSDKAEKVTYRVTNLYWQQEYGGQ